MKLIMPRASELAEPSVLAVLDEAFTALDVPHTDVMLEAHMNFGDCEHAHDVPPCSFTLLLLLLS